MSLATMQHLRMILFGRGTKEKARRVTSDRARISVLKNVANTD